MNYSRETVKMAVPPGNRTIRGVLEQYVAGLEDRGRQEGRPYPWAQSAVGVIHEIFRARWE